MGRSPPPGRFDSEVLTAPARYNFPQANIYRLKLINIPGRPGVELYPTLEIAPAQSKTDAFLAHSAIPVQFTSQDFDEVLSGSFVTKVIYLPRSRVPESRPGRRGDAHQYAARAGRQPDHRGRPARRPLSPSFGLATRIYSFPAAKCPRAALRPHTSLAAAREAHRCLWTPRPWDQYPALIPSLSNSVMTFGNCGARSTS